MRKAWLVAILLILLQFSSIANTVSDSLLIQQLVERISKDQINKGNADFFEGMFPAFREWGAWPVNRQPDNNVFFTAITSFTLRNLLPKLKQEQQQLVNTIINKASRSYPNFLNRKKNGFYEFFPTDKTFMPNSLFLKYFKQQLSSGEDADDCVMIFMTSKHPDSILELFHKRLIKASNLETKKITNTFKRYRDFPAYSTFLGTKMGVDFDFCVQTNIMYFMLEQKKEFIKQDEATISLLLQNVQNRDYMFHPEYISPWYARSSVLIYHIARLLSTYDILAFAPYKSQLIDDANYLLKHADNIMDKIILSTSILRLGGVLENPFEPKDLNSFEQSNHNSFPFFQARGSGLMSDLPKKIFSNQGPAFYFNFSCPTYNRTLLLEYLLERQKYF